MTNSTAPEKVNAALCYGIGTGESFSCTFNASLVETRCTSAESSYVVQYTETSDGTLGTIYELPSGAHLGTVVQSATGAYVIKLDNGVSASCVINGDKATLCIDP